MQLHGEYTTDIIQRSADKALDLHVPEFSISLSLLSYISNNILVKAQ